MYFSFGFFIEKLFPYLGIRFVAVNDNYDSIKDKNGTELVVSLKNPINDLYAKAISQKVINALEVKQRKGEFIGALPPYGYLKSKEDKHKLVLRIEIEPALKLEDLLRQTQKKSGFRKMHEALLKQINLKKQKIGQNTAYQTMLFESFSEHVLTEQAYVSLKQGYDQKTDVYQKELEELEKEEQIYSKALSPQNQWIKALEECQIEKTIIRKMAVELSDHIKVTGYNEIEIVWNFKDEFIRLKNHREFDGCMVMEFCNDGYTGTNFDWPAVQEIRFSALS